MILPRFWRRPQSGRHNVLAGLLVSLCLAGHPAVAALPEGQTGFVNATLPAGTVTDDIFYDILGNRTRMIQISCVIGAIGVFFLTRKYR